MTAQSTVSINLERCVPPTNNTHSLDKDLLDSSIVRESTPIITERRMDGPRRQRKRRTPVPRYHYPKHVEVMHVTISLFHDIIIQNMLR